MDSGLPDSAVVALSVVLPLLAVCVTLVLVLVTRKRDLVDWFDFKFLYHHDPPPVGFLRGNFAPTPKEVTNPDLVVTRGELPASLDGCFLRNGPNPFFEPLGKYHWFDGDGMVHGVRIRGGRASYANRWIETSRLIQERRFGRPAFSKIGELTGKAGLFALASQNLKKRLGLLDLGMGTGTANTSLVFHHDKLLALYESDLPYALKVMCSGAVETIERATVEAADIVGGGGGKKGGAGFEQFTAHPKIDPRTGEMHFFGYNLRRAPHLTYGVLDAGGSLVKSIPIDLPHGPAMMHDMALTETYAVFLYMPLYFRPKEMVQGSGFPFVFDADLPSKFALLRRDAEDASGIQWFDLPAGMIFHAANAWDSEEDGKVYLYACSTSEYTLGDLISSNSTRYPMATEPSGSKSMMSAGGTARFMPGAHGGMSMMERARGTPLDFAVPPGKHQRMMSEDGGSSVGASSSFRDGGSSRDVLNLSGRDGGGSSTSLFEFTFDPKTGLATQAKIVDPRLCCDGAYMVEFPIVHPKFLSRPNRYVYLATFCDGMKTNGVVKCDLSMSGGGGGGGSAVVGRIRFGSKRFGGESIFVPRSQEEVGEEDDGFLMTFVWDAGRKTSFLLVHDARTMELVAEVDVRARVPFGFHGAWLGAEEMRKTRLGEGGNGEVRVDVGDG